MALTGNLNHMLNFVCFPKSQNKLSYLIQVSMRVLILQCLFLIDRVWLHNYALISITQTSAMLRNAVAAAVDVLTIVTVSTLYTYV